MTMNDNCSTNIVVVESPDDLESIPLDMFQSVTKHVLLVCKFESVAEKIEHICREERVFSIMSIDHSERLEKLAKRTDAIPIFYVSSKEEALSIVADLIEDPFSAIQKALNYETVFLRYLEGHPS